VPAVGIGVRAASRLRHSNSAQTKSTAAYGLSSCADNPGETQLQHYRKRSPKQGFLANNRVVLAHAYGSFGEMI